MEALHHPNIVGILDVFMGDTSRIVLQDGGQPLGRGIREPDFIRRIMRQLFYAVSHLHQHDIIHCNIEPSNLLVDDRNVLRLAGFEDARIEREGFREEISDAIAAEWGLHVGLLPFRAPEILLGNTQFSFGVDLWSIGCVMWSMAVEGAVFEHQTTVTAHSGEVLEVICSKIGGPDQEDLAHLSRLPCWQDKWAQRQRFLLDDWPLPACFGDADKDLLEKLLCWSASR